MANLRRSSRVFGPVALWPSFFMWGAIGFLTLGGCAGDARGEDGIHVLLISLDSTRRDMFGTYGYVPPHAPDRSPTPNMDRLAAEGVVFEAATATSSWTLPAHIAILTGQPDLVHAVELDVYRLDAGLSTLAEVLARGGYRTAGFYSGPYLHPRFGFGRGFERYEECYGSELREASRRAVGAAQRLEALQDEGMSASLLDAFEANVRAQEELERVSHRDLSSANVADAVIAELTEIAAGGRPAFVFAHFFDPHFDYDPPPPFDERFDPDYEGSLSGENFYRDPRIATFDQTLPSGRRRVASDRDLEHIRALYAGDLAYTDAHVGRILDALGELGLTDRTLVVVIGDHGDEFFEHGGLGHRRTLYEEVLAVPLIMRLPNELEAGMRISQAVSAADVFATVLGVVGLGDGSGGGRGLVPLLAGSVDEGEPGARGVMSRLVLTRPVPVQLPPAAGGGTIPADGIQVIESFRSDAIKIIRRRSWIRPPANASPEAKAFLNAEAERMFASEALFWADLDRAGSEAPGAYSQEFTDPRALSVLTEFRAQYADLAARRRSAEPAPSGDEAFAALRGLGYLETRMGESAASAEFVLPLPGEAFF